VSGLREIPHSGAYSYSSLRDSSKRNESEGSLTLPFAPLGEALAATPAAPAWVWEGYLARGVVTVLAGRPKCGKSTLFFGFLEALATGEPLIGQQVRAAGALLFTLRTTA
jgi:hypothetical protein